jgi:hypothetical protein
MWSLGVSLFLVSHIPWQTSLHTASRRKGGNYQLHLVLNHFLLVLHVGLREGGSEKEWMKTPRVQKLASENIPSTKLKLEKADTQKTYQKLFQLNNIWTHTLLELLLHRLAWWRFEHTLGHYYAMHSRLRSVLSLVLDCLSLSLPPPTHPPSHSPSSSFHPSLSFYLPTYLQAVNLR